MLRNNFLQRQLLVDKCLPQAMQPLLRAVTQICLSLAVNSPYQLMNRLRGNFAWVPFVELVLYVCPRGIPLVLIQGLERRRQKPMKPSGYFC
jgi:hypothetical protein